MKYHTTKDGIKIALKDLDINHLRNILKLISRKAKKGIIIAFGEGVDAHEIWYEEEELTGEEALKALHYYDYKAELDKREKP